MKALKKFTRRDQVTSEHAISMFNIDAKLLKLDMFVTYYRDGSYMNLKLRILLVLSVRPCTGRRNIVTVLKGLRHSSLPRFETCL